MTVERRPGSRDAFGSRAWLAPRSTAELEKVIYACGLANLLAFGLLVPVSYGIAAVSPFGLRQPEETAAFHRLVDQVALPDTAATVLKSWLAGDSVFAHRAVSAVVCGLPLLVSTAAFLVVAVTLSRCRALLDEKIVSLLFRMAVAFALVNVFAYPMFTQDFWFYVAWGRMVAQGQNPYYSQLTADALAGLPIQYFSFHMMYGPLWALLSVTLAALSGRNVILEFIAYKLVLALFWILSLAVVRRMLPAASPAQRALAVCLFGWLPISFHASVAEGHNDIVMIFFLLLWMYLVARCHPLSPVALAASALIKYVTLPLFAVAVTHVWVTKALPRRQYLAPLLLSVVFAAAVFAPFWRGSGFFSGLSFTRGGVFLTPAHAISSVANGLHLRISEAAASNGVIVAFGGIVLFYAFRYFHDATFARFSELTLAILCAVLFAGTNHMWPWYIIWVLAPAAVAPQSALLRFVTPVAILGPFLNLYWLLAPGWGMLPYASVAFFALATGAMLLFPREGLVTPEPPVQLGTSAAGA